MTPRTLVTSCAVLFAAALSAHAADAPKRPADVSPDLAPILKQHDLPGMVAAVVDGDGNVLAAGAAGVRKRGGRDRVTLNDKFHVGSCTKAMTATLCALLVEEGKLKWDTTVAQALPDVKPMHAGWRKVTLEHLLQNRGGAPGDVNPVLWAALWGQKGTAARRMLARGILAQPPASEPGDKYAYSNAGFAIAGHMAERVTGRPWEDLMRERLFKPLGMSSAGFGAPTGNQPRGHKADGTPVEPNAVGSDNPAAIGPAGTAHCSVGDWAKFVALHLAAERGQGGQAKLLKAETFRKLHRAPEGGEYAMGWVVVPSPLGEGKALMHAGSNTLWFCVTWIVPKQNRAVLVMCNQGAPGEAADKACDEAAGKLLRKQFDHANAGAAAD